MDTYHADGELDGDRSVTRGGEVGGGREEGGGRFGGDCRVARPRPVGILAGDKRVGGKVKL